MLHSLCMMHDFLLLFYISSNVTLHSPCNQILIFEIDLNKSCSKIILNTRWSYLKYSLFFKVVNILFIFSCLNFWIFRNKYEYEKIESDSSDRFNNRYDVSVIDTLGFALEYPRNLLYFRKIKRASGEMMWKEF